MDYCIDYFIKSEKLKSFLTKIKNNGLKQAYIFNSNDNLKNYASSFIFSVLANCKGQNKPCLSCESCVKILNQTSLDLFVYPKTKSIVVDDIKEIIDSCYVLPFENEYKIYILNDFENANIASQNKFLKTLEEPPKSVIFIINTTNIDKILDTIKSRCQIINLPSFENNEIEQVLKQNNKEIDITLLENCDNELGKYLSLEENNFKEKFLFCLDMLKNLNSSSEILNYSSKMINDKDNLSSYFVSIIAIFKDLLNLKLNKNFVKNKSKINDLEFLFNKFSIKAINHILEDILLINKELNYNTNENLAIDVMLINILEEKHKWN